jgi:hypothetical protein
MILQVLHSRSFQNTSLKIPDVAVHGSLFCRVFDLAGLDSSGCWFEICFRTVETTSMIYTILKVQVNWIQQLLALGRGDYYGTYLG